jgi:hypothetical protein
MKERTDGDNRDLSSQAPTADTGSRLSGATKRNLVALAIVAVLVALAFVSGNQATKPRLTGDTIARTFAPGDPCSSTSLAVNVSSETDPSTAAQRLFSALEPMEGINTASLNVKTSRIEVGFCESSASEQSVREALLPTGLLAE